MSEALNAAIASLMNEGGTENKLLLSCGTGWFHLRGSCGSSDVVCHAAANAYLPTASRLLVAQVHRLRQAGFRQRNGERALSQTFSLGSTEERDTLISKLSALFSEVYGVEQLNFRWEVQMGDAPTVTNAPLLEAVRAVAKQRLPRLRQALYRQLLMADLLLLVDDEGAPRVVGDISGWPCFALFTDTASLTLWDPRGGLVNVVKGRTLFPNLMQHRFGSVFLNQHGLLGGELYRNEVEMLANAAVGRSV